MNDQQIGEILMRAIEKMALQERDESWKKEAALILDERIQAFNKLNLLSFQQRPTLN